MQIKNVTNFPYFRKFCNTRKKIGYTVLVPDWNKYNSFAIAISSHGLEIEKIENGKTVKHHAILMFDDVTFDTKDVLGYFSDKECTGLIDKAKIFFIQV